MGRLSLRGWGVNLENGFLAAADESILQLYRWRTVIDPLHAHHAHVPSAGLVEMRPFLLLEPIQTYWNAEGWEPTSSGGGRSSWEPTRRRRG